MPLKKFMMEALERFRKGRTDKNALSSPSVFNAADKIKKRKARMKEELKP